MRITPYKWLMQQTKPAQRWLFLSIIFGVLSGTLIIIQAGLLSTIIDHVYLHHATVRTLSTFLISLIIIILCRPVISWAREMIAFQSANEIKKVVRKKLLNLISQCSPIQLAHFKSGALTTTLIEQIEALHGFFADYLPQMSITIILPLIILVIVWMQNWVAGLILLITAPLIPLFMALIGINTAKLNQENFQALSKMSAHFLDRLQGLTTLILFHRAESQIETIKTVSDDYREKTMKILRVAFLSTATLELFSTIAIAMIAVYLGLGLLGFLKIGFEGVHITLMHALFILLLAPEFFMPLRQLGTFYHARAEAIGAADAILKIIEKQQDQNTSATHHDVLQKNINPIISLKHVSFSYYQDQKIIHDFDLTIPFGNCVAIIGASGSGKTTLINLMMKFLQPTEGDLFVNQTNLNNIDGDDWRESISLLHQHPRLFYGTIIENIRFARPHATDDEVENAARLSGVLDFTQQLPNGLHTFIGEQNLGLSGGQAQRVALARIILKNTPTILLDEPTAHLDDKNKAIILKLLAEWKNKKTVIIATHDKTIANVADRVINLNEKKR